ncbi:hypothetical protein YB2330_003942 [Saitoella coloradoensis]
MNRLTTSNSTIIPLFLSRTSTPLIRTATGMDLRRGFADMTSVGPTRPGGKGHLGEDSWAKREKAAEDYVSTRKGFIRQREQERMQKQIMEAKARMRQMETDLDETMHELRRQARLDSERTFKLSWWSTHEPEHDPSTPRPWLKSQTPGLFGKDPIKGGIQDPGAGREWGEKQDGGMAPKKQGGVGSVRQEGETEKREEGTEGDIGGIKPGVGEGEKGGSMSGR